MQVFELERRPDSEHAGAAAVVVADSEEEALGLLGWEGTVRGAFPYRGTRRLPWIVAEYNDSGELLVDAGAVNV